MSLFEFRSVFITGFLGFKESLDVSDEIFLCNHMFREYGIRILRTKVSIETGIMGVVVVTASLVELVPRFKVSTGEIGIVSYVILTVSLELVSCSKVSAGRLTVIGA